MLSVVSQACILSYGMLLIHAYFKKTKTHVFVKSWVLLNDAVMFHITLPDEQEIFKNPVSAVMKTSSGSAKTTHSQISLNSQQAQKPCCLQIAWFPYLHHNPTVSTKFSLYAMLFQAVVINKIDTINNTINLHFFPISICHLQYSRS